MEILTAEMGARNTGADRIVASLRGQCQLLCQLAEIVETDRMSRHALERRISEVEVNLRKLRAAV